MDEGEQFEQVEPAQIGIAEPLPDQRRVEEDMRRFRRPGDRLAAPRLAHLAVACAIQMPAWVAWSAGRGKGAAIAADIGAAGTKEQQ